MIQSMDDAQDKMSNKVDKSFKKQKKRIPLSEESWKDLTIRGASLAEQFEWIKIQEKIKNKLSE